MVRVLQLIALILLLVVGAGATYAIVYPGETKGLAKQMIRSSARSSTPAKREPARPAVSTSTAAAKSVASASKEPATARPVANSRQSGSGSPPPRGTPAASGGKKPPTKQEMEAKKRMEANRGKLEEEPTRRALSLGASPDPINTPPPAAELYPFKVSRRTFPTPDLIRLELNIKNASGTFWQTAYVALRGADPAKTVVFRVDDWRIDEVVGLDYTFPKEELESRVKDLRVARVTGIKRESALSDLVGDIRSSVVGDTSRGGTTGGKTTTTTVPDGRTYASVEVPGLLGLLASVRGPSAGLDVRVSSSGGAIKDQIPLAIPLEHMLPQTLDIGLFADTPARTEARKLLDEAFAEGQKVQSQLGELIKVLANTPYEEAQKSDIPAIKAKIAESLATFDKKSLDLAVLANKVKDPKVSDAEAAARGMADKLVKMLTSIEKQVQKLDARFKLLPE